MASRLTFRERSPDICWQKVLRDKYLDEGCPDVPHLSLKKATIRKVSRKLAEQIILKYEWLGTMAKSSYHYGIFFGPYCAGVCCFAGTAGAAGTHLHEQFKINRDELGILCRGACSHWAPPSSNSKLVSIATRLFLKDSQNKVVMAFSDSDAGEIGTIYQACNWVYIGKGQIDFEWVSPKGKTLNRRMIGKLSKKNRWSFPETSSYLRKMGWYTQPTNPKGRYAFSLDPMVKKRLERMRKPYPKRPASIDSDAPTFQVG